MAGDGLMETCSPGRVLRASITCDEGERSSLLDSFTGRKSCRQVAEEAQDQRCNVGVTRSPVVFSWHLRGTNRQDLCGCFSGGPISRLGFTSLSESVWTRGSKDVAFSGTGHSSVTPAARNARLSRMELQHPPWQRWRVGICHSSTLHRNVEAGMDDTIRNVCGVLT